MPLPDSVRAKLDHTKFHLDLIYKESNRYLRDNPGEMVPNPDGDPHRPTFVYREKNPVPARISLLTGDCLQSLRSAFDYLVWELVLVAGNTPSERQMFPVCRTESAFQDAKRGKRLDGIVAGSEALIQSLQPYTHTNPGEHWLAVLDNLSWSARPILNQFV